MRSVIINGEEAAIKSDGLQVMAEFIELIKNSIDPEHMITGILLDGKELDDADWQAGLGQYETSIIEVETGTPVDFVSSRLANAPSIIQACFMEFRASRKNFQDGRMSEGNKDLLQAVNTLQAFFEWYGTLLELMSEEDRIKFNITERADKISEICKQICQQQLYQSWWALGETIHKELEPELDNLEDFCRKLIEE